MVLSPHFQELPFKEDFQQLKHLQSLKLLLMSVLKCLNEFLNSFLKMLKKTEAEFSENGSSPHFCRKASEMHGIGCSAFSEAFSHLVKKCAQFFPPNMI